MRILGRNIYWSEQDRTLEERSLESVEITDIGLAFDRAQARLVGVEDTSIPALYRGFQLLTDTVASLPMAQFMGRTRTEDTPDVLDQPERDETYHSSIAKIVSSLLFRGNAYLWPRSRTERGEITSIYVLNPDEVSVSPDSRNLYPEYRWRGNLMTTGKTIIPIHLNRWPGRWEGVSPISAARLMLEGAKAEGELSRNLASDDATPGGLLEVPQRLSKPEADEVRQMWEDSRGGRRKRISVLSGGVEFKPLTFSPVDAQFLEARNFSVQEIGRLLGLHGFFLLVDSGSSLTYSTTESLFRLLLTSTLRPTYLEPIEQAFSRLLPDGRRARFLTDEILRADIGARYSAYEIGVRSGFLTPNEVREAEGLDPIAGGDELRVSDPIPAIPASSS